MSQARERTRRREQREEAREKISAAAVEMLRTERFRDLSVETLMARTDLARTAFYRYYDDVSALVLQLLAEVGAELYTIVERWAEDGATDFPGATHRAMTDIVDYFRRNGPLVLAVSDAAAADELVEKAYQEFLAVYERLMVRSFDLLVERGDLPACDTAALAQALNLMGERYLVASFGRPPYADPETVVTTMELVWTRTIGFQLG
ncbi:TetR/AcrR family transcriptional regulator [Marmoricola sp. RAF53]|uniref:TetR/AcrR family transcriptional regulator n=1 Tax=Marmoricola sp. RAF53 TaxID=3233059 RepID=UPI003F9DDF5F